MGRTPTTGGVRVRRDRIGITLTINGKQIEPTLDLRPTEANLKHARRQRKRMLQAIRDGDFDLAAEFPDYKHAADFVAVRTEATFDSVRDKFLLWIKTRQAHSSVLSLERKLKSFWSPTFGDKSISSITYAQLSDHVAARQWGSNKTHNNYVSALREMYGYAHDHGLIEANPAQKLRMLKLQRPDPDPYTVEEAEALIACARKVHGELDSLYWELAFLLGMRPGEQISIQWADHNRVTGKLTVRRMRTEGEDKDSTKTNETRHMKLPPRAVEVLKRLRLLTGMKPHGHLFEDHLTGAPIEKSHVMRERWVTVSRLAGVRYREPYQARHTSVSWKLMAGMNFMQVAKLHGHSLATMLKTYAHWVETEDGDVAEVARIRRFHGEGVSVAGAIPVQNLSRVPGP
jgi:integrase